MMTQSPAESRNLRGSSPEDEGWMARALELGRAGRGRTAPNPIVGAVVVRDGRVVGEGFHERAGAPHAEALALARAGEAARGATLYVTLEPCSHQGRTPPCAPAVVAAGVSRVVSALEDPDPRVRGAGHRLLREAGLRVDVGAGEAAARRDNAEYLHRVASGRCFGVLKAAVTLDGRLGADGGDSRWITGAEARLRAHELRDAYDAVLVGRGTLERDDPRLDVRLSRAGRSPVAVVVDSGLAAPAERQLWKRAKEGCQVIVAAVDGVGEERAARLERLGVQVLRTAPDSAGRVSLPELFRLLADGGLNSVMLEGGEAVHTAALTGGLVQRAHVFVAPLLLGGTGGPRLVGDLGIRRVSDAFRLVDPEVERLGADLLVSGRVESGGS
jgi:diaminohydroxyphosphoribosylaminopyrimidine deaminase/5-amino-6-(5-phosphoribosylamino)uracil reductase